MRHRLRRAMIAATALPLLLAGCSGSEPDVTIGLITKQETNPYWVTMRDVAQTVAGDENVKLLTATGSSDVDVDSEIKALEDFTAQGVDGILIAPTDSTALNPAIEAARAAGITVIALDTPTDPADVVNATLATDNERAGRLAGEYAGAKVAELGLDARILTLDLAPGIASGEARHAGFLAGFGIESGDPQVVASVDTQGDQDKAREAMAQALVEHPDLTVVYTVNEPAALGAVEALKDADVDLSQVVVVSIDGGCEAIKGAVRPGDIDATVQQYPENMARLGVEELAAAARGGPTPSGFRDTGAELITGDPAPGVASRDIAFGVRNCWGD